MQDIKKEPESLKEGSQITHQNPAEKKLLFNVSKTRKVETYASEWREVLVRHMSNGRLFVSF